MKKKTLFLILLASLTIFSGCEMINNLKDYFNPPKAPDQKTEEEKTSVKETIETGEATVRFASYKSIPSTAKPNVAPYQVPKNLKGVVNLEKFEESAKAKTVLEKNAFVVTPGEMKEFFQLYEDNRYQSMGSFVTSDALLHNYHLLFNYLLRNLEKDQFYSETKKLTAEMVDLSKKQYTEAKGTTFENAAGRNLAYFSVASILIGNEIEVETSVKDVVAAELELINAHQGIAVSQVQNMGQEDVDPTMAYKEDYSQYVPRGHYSKTEELKKYFNTMMWFGRVTFRLKSDDEVKSALLMTSMLKSSPNTFKSWEKIYEPINFFVGKSDDITYYDFEKLMKAVYGASIETADLKDSSKFDSFKEKAENLPAPAINSVPVFEESINPDREEEIKGFRFMGQRFTIDASIFQRLVDREVKDRKLPKGLDIPAALGSQEALSILESEGEIGKYPDYQPQLDKVKKYLKNTPESNWTQNLYFGWMYTLTTLTNENKEGYPTFMQNEAWKRKDLNTFMGSYTELKHDTILYAKQVYAEMGGIDDTELKGYVEPNVELYSRLASLSKMTVEGLEKRNLLVKKDKDLLLEMEELCLKMKTISEKELEEKTLTDDEYESIKFFGGDLEHFWVEAFKDENVVTGAQAYDKPAALVADIATDPNGFVLEEGIGDIYEIYVVVPIEGKLHLVKGGVFSHYEFKQPLQDRLTDEAWQKKVKEKDLPPLNSWTKDYIVLE